MTFSPRLSSGSPKIRIFIVLKLWTFISSSFFFWEHASKISHNSQKDISNGVLHAPIEDDFIIVLRGFVVRSQVPNLTPNPFIDHNLCISGLNGQCKGTLAFTFQKLSNDILRAPFGACLPFQLRL
jgi:hypothetical protein